MAVSPVVDDGDKRTEMGRSTAAAPPPQWSCHRPHTSQPTVHASPSGAPAAGFHLAVPGGRRPWSRLSDRGAPATADRRRGSDPPPRHLRL